MRPLQSQMLQILLSEAEAEPIPASQHREKIGSLRAIFAICARTDPHSLCAHVESSGCSVPPAGLRSHSVAVATGE